MSSGFLVAIVILLTLIVLGLAVVVFSLARQIGVLYERIAPAGALSVNQVVKAGNQAEKLPLQTIYGAEIVIGDNGGRSQLIFFLSPDCPVCKQLLHPLKSAARSEKDWLDVVLASDGDDVNEHTNFIQREGLGDFPYVVSEILGKTYGISKLPYGVLIDEQGRIAALGIVNSREHLESLFEAKEQGVSDIQTYMAQQSSLSDDIAKPEIANLANK